MDYKVLLNNKKNDSNDSNDSNEINDYFFIKDGKIVNLDEIQYFENINNEANNAENKFINLECHRKLKGGDILGDIIGAILGFLNPIVAPIIAIGNLFITIIKFIFWLIKFVIWFIQFLVWLMFDLLNPINFVNDFFKSLMLITVSVCRIPLDLVLALYKLGINTIAGWMQGFWGWDMSNLSKADKNSPYFQRINKNKGQKVYYTNSNTVPFSIILGTILCPPMGVFMDLGTSGWINIIICALLTLLFYIPGLCYALLIIYS